MFDTCKQLLSLTVASACSCQGLRDHKTVRPLHNQAFGLLSLVGARLLSLSTWKPTVVLKQQRRLSFSHYEEKVEGLEGFKIMPLAFLKASLHPTKGLFNLQPQ